MSRVWWPGWLVSLGLTMTVATAARAQVDSFPHPKHARLFPTCTSCHVGATEAGQPILPDSASCASCHDGTIERLVDWRPPAAPRPTMLRFEHAEHRAVLVREAEAGRPLTTPVCTDCHTGLGTPRMEIRRAALERCLTCHGIQSLHLAAADRECETCHLPLARNQLTEATVKMFPEPPSHEAPDFLLEQHGAAAKGGIGRDDKPAPVAASCATCHARDFCIQCHVNAPEQQNIQALAPDPRSLAIAAKLEEPPGHEATTFLATHGVEARRVSATCATCHTRESCLTCHAVMPRGARAVYAAGPGRSEGASITRHPPPSHDGFFRDRHAAGASATPTSCAGCHARAECLDCHRPQAASSGSYHPSGFLARHPAAAYVRETSCADCHNQGAFCAACHAQAGLSASRALGGAGYHDAKQFFMVGHGGAARRNLESCVSCHVERDCLTCHSVIGGRRFNPHGPGFNAAELKKRNPETCTACHGFNIP